MSIQEKHSAKKRGEKPLFFPFFQEVKSRGSRRDFFWARRGKSLEIDTNSDR